MVVKHKKTGRSIERSNVMFDTLENRTLLANSSGMEVISANHNAAPPAIVEYAGLSTTRESLPVDPNTNQGVELRNLGIYNSTFSGEHFGRAVYWNGVSPWFPGGRLDTSRATIERVANIAQNGGLQIHNNRPVAAGTMTVLDFEIPAIARNSPTYFADRVRWFKAKAPDVKVGTYGIETLQMNLDYLARFNEADRAEFDRRVLARREVIEAVDFIGFDSYLVSPSTVDRDLRAMQNFSDAMHRLFPDKPLIPFVWGAYNTAWNPAGSVFSDEVTVRYVEMCRQAFDAVIIWGPRSDNEKLIAAFNQPENLLLPAGRQVSWANDPVTQDPPPVTQPSPKDSGGGDGTVGEDVLGLNP